MKIKGIILAAGLATRLRPLSLERPKVLFPIPGDKTILNGLCRFMSENNITQGWINAFHLSEQIENAVSTQTFPISLQISKEEELLGTAGGIAEIIDADLGEADVFLTVNGDVWCRGDVSSLLQTHIDGNELITLLLLPWNGVETRGLIRFDRQGYVTAVSQGAAQNNDESTGVFTGIYAVSQKIKNFIPADRPACMVRDVIIPMISKGERIKTVTLPIEWDELGTIKSYFNFCMRSAAADGAVLFPGCSISDGAKITNSIVWPEAVVKRGETLEYCIRTKNTTVEINNRR